MRISGNIWPSHLHVVLQVAVLPAFFLALYSVAMAEERNNDDVERLIEALASPNRKPTVSVGDKGERKLSYPPGYDHLAQEKVLEAWDALMEKGVAAFPQLIAHMNDGRYSCIIRPENEFFYVGSVCHSIIETQVDVFESFILQVPGKPYTWVPNSYPGNVEIKEWWREHYYLSLRELQLEAVRWALANEQRRRYDKKLKAKNIAGLKRLLDRLEESDLSIRVDRRGAFIKEMAGGTGS